jgi:hypothetical protein
MHAKVMEWKLLVKYVNKIRSVVEIYYFFPNYCIAIAENQAVRTFQTDLSSLFFLKKVGFNSIDYAADWDYFEEVLKLSPSITKIDKVLFVHN